MNPATMADDPDLPRDGATWRGTIPGLNGTRTWTFQFPHWTSQADTGGYDLACRPFTPAGADITRRWAATQPRGQ